MNLWDVAAGLLILQEAGGEAKISNHDEIYHVKIREIMAAGQDVQRFINALNES